MAAQAGTVPRQHPTRTCVACRTERQKRDLVRVVRSPDGTVSLDLGGRVAGRGAYLCADGSCWATALKRRSIERALSVSLPAEVRERLASLDHPSIEGGTSGT